MRFRLATHLDQDAVCSVLVAAYGEFERELGDAWQDMRQSLLNAVSKIPSERFIVAEHAGKLAGVVAYYPAGQADVPVFQNDWASIRLLGVDPQYRGQGIARQLTEHCIQCAQAEHARCIALYTSELMQVAQRLYRSLGFTLHSELPAHYGMRYWLFVCELLV